MVYSQSEIQETIERLIREHRDLDHQVGEMQAKPACLHGSGVFALRDTKKRRLYLKDEITRLAMSATAS